MCIFRRKKKNIDKHINTIEKQQDIMNDIKQDLVGLKSRYQDQPALLDKLVIIENKYLKANATVDAKRQKLDGKIKDAILDIDIVDVKAKKLGNYDGVASLLAQIDELVSRRIA